MAHETGDRASGSGIRGILKFVGILAVLALAGLAALVILDVIPQEQIAERGTKIVLLAIIVVVANVSIAALAGSGRRP